MLFNKLNINTVLNERIGTKDMNLYLLNKRQIVSYGRVKVKESVKEIDVVSLGCPAIELLSDLARQCGRGDYIVSVHKEHTLIKEDNTYIQFTYHEDCHLAQRKIEIILSMIYSIYVDRRSRDAIKYLSVFGSTIVPDNEIYDNIATINDVNIWSKLSTEKEIE
jgi:hypothetical protein